MKTTKELTDYDKQALSFLKTTHTTFTAEFKKFGSMPFDENGEKRNIFTIKLSNSKNRYSFAFGSSIQDSCKDGAVIYSHEKTEIYCVFRQGGDASGIFFSFTFKTDYPTLLRAHKEGLDAIVINDLEYKHAYFEYSERVEAFNKKAKKQQSAWHKTYLLEEVDAMLRKAINRKIERSLKEQTKIREQADEIIFPSAYDVLTCLTKCDPGTFENFCSDFGYDTDSRKAERTYKAVCDEWEQVSKLFNEQEIELLQEIQ
jgi:hypothetical protein